MSRESVDEYTGAAHEAEIKVRLFDITLDSSDISRLQSATLKTSVQLAVSGEKSGRTLVTSLLVHVVQISRRHRTSSLIAANRGASLRARTVSRTTT